MDTPFVMEMWLLVAHGRSHLSLCGGGDLTAQEVLLRASFSSEVGCVCFCKDQQRINKNEGINTLTFIVKKNTKQNIFTKNEKATVFPVLVWRVVAEAIVIFVCQK